jgi:hypothetical protein
MMNPFMRRALPILVIAIVLISLTPATVRAQSPWFTIDPSTGPAGIGVTITGGGDFLYDLKGDVIWGDDGSVIGNAEIVKGDPSGSFYIPGYASPGEHKIILDTGSENASQYFTVIATKPSDTPVPVPAPYIKDFSLDPQTIIAGNCAILYWSVNNAQAVTIYGDFGSQSVDDSGSLNVCPLKTTNYEINAEGYEGADPSSASDSALLTVTTIGTYTPTLTPSRTPTITASRTTTGYINQIITPSFTPTFTPSLTPSITPAINQQLALQVLFPATIFEYGIPLFNNPLGVLNSSVSRLPSTPPCGSLSIGRGATLLTFDDVPVGQLTDHYPGVSFAPGTAFVDIPTVPTHSGSMALTNAEISTASLTPYASTFSGHPILMNFTQPVLAVGTYVGRQAPSRYSYEAVVALLRGYDYDSMGNISVITSNFIELPGSPTPIDRCLQINAPAGQVIRSAALEFFDSRGNSVVDTRWVDDLTFLPATTTVRDLPPQVQIQRPVPGATISTDTVYLTANVTEDIRLASVTVAINDNPPETVPEANISRDALNPNLYHFGITLRTDQLRTFADNIVEVTALDSSSNSGRASTHFTYRPASQLNIFVYHGQTEITQAVQCMGDNYHCADNSIPLFTDRPTLIRVYPGVEGGSSTSGSTRVEHIGGALCLGDTGAAGCSNPLRPVNGITIDGFRGISMLQGNLADSMNFILPQDWVRAGQLVFTVYINYNQENAAESDYSDNYATETVTILPGKTLDVFFVEIDANGFRPDMSLRWNIADGLFAMYPVSRVQLWRSTVGTSYAGTFDFSKKSEWIRLLGILSDIRGQVDSSSAPYERFYGMIPSAARSGNIAGIGWKPGWVSEGLVHTSDIIETQINAIHELAHNQGRKHISDYGGADNPDPLYTYAFLDATGVNVRTYHLYYQYSNYDFMTYHSSAEDWVSAYTYLGLYNAIGSVTSFAPSGSSSMASPVRQPEPLPYLTGSAIISPSSIEYTGSFYMTNHLNPLWDSLPAGPYSLELQDAGGSVLFSKGFGVPEVGCGGELSDTGPIQFVVPWEDGTIAIVFKFNGMEIGRRTASPNAPLVQVLTPQGGENWGPTEQQTITWTASDADGDPLSYRVQYSPDNGGTWVPLSEEIQETSLTIDTANLPGGNHGMIRVLASDGFNTGEGYSNDLFSVAAKPPEVYIANPQDNNQLPPGWPVILNAYGTDAEDGPLPSESLVWTSDRDGEVGTGDMLIASGRDMSLGDHTITMTGTDSDGQTATYTTHITITAGYTPPGVKPGTLTWIIIAGAVIEVVGIAIVVLFLLRRRKRTKAES